MEKEGGGEEGAERGREGERKLASSHQRRSRNQRVWKGKVAP